MHDSRGGASVRPRDVTIHTRVRNKLKYRSVRVIALACAALSPRRLATGKQVARSDAVAARASVFAWFYGKRRTLVCIVANGSRRYHKCGIATSTLESFGGKEKMGGMQG